jgi:predicted enzyme related to lactoylglutathione lyase
MPERDGYIPGVPCWVDTSQPDPEASLPFYRELFGWQFENVMPEGSDGSYFIGRIRGGDVAAVGSVHPGTPPMAMWNTYIWVESAEETARKVRDAGGGMVVEPFDVMDAGRMAVVTDPEGATFCLWQAKQHKGARVVNEHGSLIFNGLATRDVEGAKAFYGAVFGWWTLSLPAGVMWTVPGYGDHLEEFTPGLRSRWPRWARLRDSSTSSPPSTRFPTTNRRRRRTGASPSPSMTPMPRWPRRRRSAARSLPSPSMPRGRGWR